MDDARSISMGHSLPPAAAASRPPSPWAGVTDVTEHGAFREYGSHPAATIFPLLSGENLEVLKHDIKENGQKEDIVLFDGKILDGRNRERACKELGIAPQYCELEECRDPIAYVLSHNLYRRHLTQSQRAQCAAEAAKLKKGQAGRGRDLGPQTCGPIAKAFGVSSRSVETAKHVADKGAAEVVEAVKVGEISVNAAAKLVDAVPDKREQKRVVRGGKKAVRQRITAKAGTRKRSARRKPVDDDGSQDKSAPEITQDDEQGADEAGEFVLSVACSKLESVVFTELESWPEEDKQYAAKLLDQISKEIQSWARK